MFSEHEDGIMKAPGIISERSSRWRTFPPSARVRKSASHVKSLRWFHILLLVVLLAGQASCQSTTVPTPASPTSANVPSTENYFFDITVNFNGEKDESDIDDWLEEVFQNGLQDCVPATPVPTTPQTTTATSTVLNSSTTSTTTTASTATSTATTSNATTSTATTSTTATSTATTSTAATSTATTSNATTSTATTSTATSTATTSTAATSTATTSNATTSTATSTASTSTAAPSTATSIASTSTAAPSTATSTASTSTAAPSTATSTASTSTAAPSTAASTASTSTSKATASTSTAAPSTAASTASTATSKATTTTSTAAPSTPATSTAAKSTATSTTATSTAAPSTPATSTAAKSTATSTTAKSTATTATSTLATSTAATSTSPQDTSTTIAATTQATSTQPRKTTTTTTPPTPPNNAVIVQTIIVPAPPPTLFTGLPAADEANIQPTNVPDGSQGNRARVVRELKDRSVQTSRISKRQTTGIIQDLDTTCPLIANKKADCSVTLSLNQRVPPCCILSTLCKASKSSTEFDAVGRKVDIINPIQNECNTDSPEENSCTNTGGASQSCAASEFQSKCDAVEKNCGCSSYCNKTEAYYAYEISIQDPEISFQHVSSLISKLKVTPDCSTETDQPCPPPRVAAEYKDSSLTCGSTTTNLQSCRVVSNFKSAIGVCNVDEAVRYALKDEKQIKITRQVTRAAICGNSEFSLQVTELAWKQVPYKPADFCPAGGARVFECENGETLLILLDKTCGLQTTTPGPNVTTMQPNTTMSVNVTTTPLNTTTNATVPLNTTTTPTDAEGQANALLDLTKDVSMLNSSQINQLVSQLERLLSGPNVSLALGNTSVQIVSNLLGATPEVLSESSNRIIGIVDTVGNKLVLGEAEETLLSPDVALSVKPADGTNFQETVFSVLNPNDVQLTGGSRRSRSVRVDSSIPQGSIRLPPSLTQNLSAEAQQLASRVLFNFYQKSTVFQDKSLGERRLISGILGASVANLSISNLQDNVVINLRNTEPIPANYVARCVFWDFSMNDRSGGWNPDGCSLQNSTDNETVCGCNHLTSFAILLDLDRTPLTSRVQATILTFITYIGCGVSAIFLAITLLTYLAFGKLRKDIPSKILIQLCLALLLLNLVFLVDAWLALYPDAVGLCISTAWFLHYFLLVSFTWMGLEAVHMYLALVKVFNSYISRYMLKFSLVGWGVPMIVVIIVIAINKNNYGLISYGRFSDGSTDEFCWIKDDIAFYVAVVAYFGGIFLFNLVMFVVVLVQLCRIKRQNPHNTIHRTTLQDIRSVAGITILLGLTWGFAFFAWGPVNLAFMYLFAIFNSLHGFFIFVFHCAVKENVRRQWRTYLCCGRMRLAENSEWSRTATQKTMKKSSVTRLTPERSSKLSKSNNSSSSFLVTDSTEHLNGIGSPFDDRAITANEEPSTDVILNEINRQCRDQQAS